MIRCPLCECQIIGQSASIFIKNIKKSIEYFQCGECELKFMAPENRLSFNEEKTRYESHNNNPEDSNYKKYLAQLWELSLGYLEEDSCFVLDYGCGPSNGLEVNFSSSKYKIDSYDPYFFKTKLDKKYDFIYASECFEHFNNPLKSILEIDKLLSKKGVLAIRTEILTPEIEFESWYYKNDPTHVCFYSKKTFEFIADKFNYELAHIDKNKVILKKL